MINYRSWLAALLIELLALCPSAALAAAPGNMPDGTVYGREIGAGEGQPGPHLFTDYISNVFSDMFINNYLSVADTATLRTTSTLLHPFGIWRRTPVWTHYSVGSGACAVDDGGLCINSSNGNHWIGELGPSFTPLLFGAVGNGITNDHTALQNAINAAILTGATLKFDGAHLYANTGTLFATGPIDIEGPFQYGIWVGNQPTNAGVVGCSFGILDTNNETILAASGVTATVRHLCVQLTASNSTQASVGDALAFAPPSITSYQAGLDVEYNTIIRPFNGITLSGAGKAVGCCGEGTSADGNIISNNTIIDPANVGIAVGFYTAGAATVGNTVHNNAIVCGSNGTIRGVGVALYDGAIDYDGTENGPEGCSIGVEVIPGTVAGVGQNAQLSPARGVLGDESTLYGLLIQPQTALATVAFSEIDNGWATPGNATGNAVLISNSFGGSIEHIKFIGGSYHSWTNATSPVIDIEGNAASTGVLQDVDFAGTGIYCWGGGSCSAPLLRINGPSSNQPRNIAISGGHIGISNEAGGTTCSTGIQIEGSAPSWVAVTGTDLADCSTPASLSGNAALGENANVTFQNTAGYYPGSVYNSGAPGYVTASTTGVMLGAAAAITPKTTGKLLITVTGYGWNNTANDGIITAIRYGTGTAPAQGAAAAGANPPNCVIEGVSATANAVVPFSMSAVITGQSLGTPLWVDIEVTALTGGSAELSAYQITATEIP